MWAWVHFCHCGLRPLNQRLHHVLRPQDWPHLQLEDFDRFLVRCFHLQNKETIGNKYNFFFCKILTFFKEKP